MNGSGTVYIEVGSWRQEFRRPVSGFATISSGSTFVSVSSARSAGASIEVSPICDARLPDGSRVNAIVPPLAIDGPALTNGKFPKDKLPPEQVVRYGSISPESAEILKATGRCRVNVLISGGINSGKTTLLNCLTR